MNRTFPNRATSIKPRAEKRAEARATPASPVRGLLAALSAALILGGCAAAGPLALVPWSPIISSIVATRGDNFEERKKLAGLDATQDWPAMQAMAEEKLKRDPTVGEWNFVLGYSFFRRGDYPRAIQTLTTATERSPEENDNWGLLAESYRLSGRPQVAARILTHAISIDSNSPIPRYLLGMAFKDMGVATEAVAAWQEAVRLEPRYALAWYEIGMQLVRSGHVEDAQKVQASLSKLDRPLADALAAELAARPATGSPGIQNRNR